MSIGREGSNAAPADLATPSTASLAAVGSSRLAVELETYRDHLPTMLAEHEGTYAVIAGRQIIGFYRDRAVAVQAAFDRVGRQPVLVKQVVAQEQVHRLGGALI